ncbi:hypothetical protein [Bradyrhizobium sp. ORS 375]|uniref:hypothetical protein n=1 Tax=Bradyrhizobium sp. (strain ORS 375) TaxID=566679 RepID=UPI00111200AC|nr:hypothetical protein [Bradyrhizobium sp. ORS 375]
MAVRGQGDRRLIFLNGDFLLSDGSLASIARRFDEGQQVLLCASIRVCEERVAEDLSHLLHGDGAMVMPGRKAVSIALRALHPTVLACRVDQGLLQSAHPNQLFWRPDDASLVLRSFLLFPLAVNASRAPGYASTYCDFGWISTMVTSPSVSIVDSSDELLIMELAPTVQEVSLVKAGKLDVRGCADRMSTWMTGFSALQGDTPIVFRSEGASESAIDQVVATSGTFVREARQRISRLYPVHNHHYWRSGIASFLRNRRARGNIHIPAEAGMEASQLRPEVAIAARTRDMAKRFLMGVPGRRRPWHPYYAAEVAIKRLGSMRPVGKVELLGQFGAEESSGTTPIVVSTFDDWRAADQAVDLLWNLTLPDECAYLIFVKDLNLASGRLTVRERIAALTILERRFRIADVKLLISVDEGRAAAMNQQLAVEFIDWRRPLRSVRMILACLALLGKVLISNLSGRRLPTSEADALLLSLRRYK